MQLPPEVLGATMDVITKAYQSGRRARQGARLRRGGAGQARLHDAADAARTRRAALVDSRAAKARLPGGVQQLGAPGDDMVARGGLTVSSSIRLLSGARWLAQIAPRITSMYMR